MKFSKMKHNGTNIKIYDSQWHDYITLKDGKDLLRIYWDSYEELSDSIGIERKARAIELPFIGFFQKDPDLKDETVLRKMVESRYNQLGKEEQKKVNGFGSRIKYDNDHSLNLEDQICTIQFYEVDYEKDHWHY